MAGSHASGLGPGAGFIATGRRGESEADGLRVDFLLPFDPGSGEGLGRGGRRGDFAGMLRQALDPGGGLMEVPPERVRVSWRRS
jgi:hypothetical protein